MSLYEDNLVECVQKIPTVALDGEGGFTFGGTYGQIFKATMTMKSTKKSVTADKKTYSIRYEVYVPMKGTVPFLHVGDYFSAETLPYLCKVISEPVLSFPSSNLGFYYFDAEMNLKKDDARPEENV